jgi:DNA (cytosine-5)-methyltransferase 1
LRGYLETGNKKRKSPTADAGTSVEAGGLPRTVGTLCADAHPGAYTGQDAYTGRLIPAPISHWEGGDVHPTLNQAHNIGSPGYSNQELFSQKGAGLVPTAFRKSKRACSVTDNETWVPADASNTLNNFDLGDTRTTHAVTHPAIPIHDQATRHAGKHGDKQDGKGNGLGIGKPGDPMNTLTQGDKHAVFTPMAVRRLTPTECLRLQGFPDGWSQIPWKGKPASECPDGPQYKACGNSMAVPVMRWIGERIAAVDATL